MKKVIISLCAFVAASVLSFAQDVNQATDLYNQAAGYLSDGDKTSALEYFHKALDLASQCGEDGDEIVAGCQSIIPQLGISLAKDCLKSDNYAGAVATLEQVVKDATSYGDDAHVTEAEALIPQVYMQQGNNLMKAKDFTAAAGAYSKCLEINPANGRAALLLGQAYDKAGNAAKAEESYLIAAANGQEKAANKQLATIYLKKATKALSDKNYESCIKLAEKSVSYSENEKAYYVAGRAAQSSNKNALAIKYYEKYLELAPTASNSSDVRTVVESLKKAN